MAFGSLGALGRGFGRLGAVLGGAGGSPPVNTLVAESGSFVFSGDTMTPIVDYKLPVDAGSFAFTGQVATLKADRIISAAAGSFAFTGQDATLTPSAAGFSIVPSVTGGVTDLTGGTSGVYTKSIDVGTYSVGRMIFVGVMARTNAALAPSGVTISGVAATQVTGSHANNASTSDTSVWYVDASSVGGPVTTNGSATVVVTFGTAPSRIGLSSYSVYGASASAPSAVISTSNTPTTENTLAIPTDGTIMVFHYATQGHPAALSATNFTQDVNTNLITTQAYASLHSTPGALSGTPSVTISATASVTVSAWSFVSVGP